MIKSFVQDESIKLKINNILLESFFKDNLSTIFSDEFETAILKKNFDLV